MRADYYSKRDQNLKKVQILGAASTFASTRTKAKINIFFKNNFSLNLMYKHMHNFPFLWYTVLYTLMPNTKLTSNVRESNLSPKTIPSMYLIKWGFLSKTRHLTFRLIYFFFFIADTFSLDFCMYAYLLFGFGLYAILSIQCHQRCWLLRHV